MGHPAHNAIWSPLSWIIVAAAAAMPPAAMATDTVILPSDTRAAYQMCLEAGLPMSYNRLMEKASMIANGLGPNPLKRCEALLKAIGYDCRLDRLSGEQAMATERPVAILDETGTFCVVVRKRGGVRQLVDYPQKAVDLSDERWAKLWPRDAVILTAVPTRENGQADAVAVPAVYDFGIIEQGEVIKTTFIVENITDRPTEILSVTTSCGCALAQGDLGVLLPKQKRSFDVKFSSAQRNGYQELFCAVHTKVGFAIFRISGFVKSESAYYPKAVEFGELTPQAAPAEQVISFVADSPDGARPLISVMGPEWVRLKTTHQLHEMWHTPEDRVIVTCDPRHLGVGSLRSDIKAIYRVGGDSRSVSIPVTATVVEAKRRSLLLKATGIVPGEKFSRSLELTKLRTEAIARVQARCGSSDIAASVQRDDSGKCAVTVAGTLYGHQDTVEVEVSFCATTAEGNTLYTVYITLGTE